MHIDRCRIPIFCHACRLDSWLSVGIDVAVAVGEDTTCHVEGSILVFTQRSLMISNIKVLHNIRQSLVGGSYLAVPLLHFYI